MDEIQNKIDVTYCIKCEKTFSCLSNLKRHIKNLHAGDPSYLNSLKKRNTSDKNKLECEFCKKTFASNFSLKRHLVRNKFVSSSFSSKCVELHGKKVNSRPQSTKNYLFFCDECPRKFMYKTNFSTHLKTHYPNEHDKAAVKKEKCSLCDHFDDKKTLLKHYEAKHKIKPQEKTYIFPSIEDFFSWKLRYEKETNTKFVKSYNTLRGGHIYKGFNCHHSGTFVTKSKGIRNTRVASIKTGGFCPATIRLKKKNGGLVKAQVVETHVGH